MAAAFILSAVLSHSALATQLIVHPQPVRLRHLSGRIVDRKGFPIPYASVELRPASGDRVLATTFADADGDFYFADRKLGTQLQLRASLAGFDIVQYAVVLRFLGKSQLKMVLPVAS